MAQQRPTVTIVLTGAVMILIGLVLGYLKGFKYGVNLNRGPAARAPSAPSLPAYPSNPALDLMTAEIIKELNCVCGCKMELSPCTCDEKGGAKEIRTFVQTLVQRQVTRAEMIKHLTEKYGEAVLIKKT